MNLLSAIAPNLIWPLAFLVLALFLAYKMGDDLSPLFTSVISGLADHAKTYATAYAFGALLAIAASLQELADVATQMHWAYVAAGAKVIQPGLVAVIGYVMKTPQPKPPVAEVSSPVQISSSVPSP